jgi:nitrite reductase/ring-hydroxylating ferredoxin subunit/alkylhydroperoxidase/carboxymuconolactone decarboxylase family protein YurZ
VSKALKYLTAARPEAMAAYFDFLRANGERLEPKTRALISIITKVANQTESGLRQYALKAIRDDVSGDEILDAIMMAFPALGLSKTVWAIDILLDCGVLQEDEGGDAQRGTWHDIGAALDAGGIQVLECKGRHLFAVQQQEKWRVFDAKCPHHGTDLAFCEVRGTTVECPLHGWRFDLKDGRCVRFGTQDLEELETRIDGSRLLALW